MNSSQNLEKMPSPQRYEKRIEKYDLIFELGIETVTREEWIKVYRDPDGQVVKEEDLQALAEQLKGQEKKRISIDWEKSGNTIECKKVISAYLVDVTDHSRSETPVKLLATPEGPIMGLVEGSDEKNITLRDPCVVIYDGKGKINLTPIFNVADTITFKQEAIRNEQVPNEILIALYPGFILQNRMMKYQLRPTTPYVVSPELGTDAE